VFKNAKKYLGFDDRWLMLFGIPFCTLLIELMIFGTAQHESQLRHCIGVCLVFTIVYWISFRWVIISYHKKYPGSEWTWKRLAYISIMLLVTYLTVKFSVGILLTQVLGESLAQYETDKVSPYIVEISELLLVALMYFIYEGIYYFNRSRMFEMEKNKLQKISAEQKLNTLKNQVNPHFLFNSLNTVVTMIPEEPDLAIRFVQKLSKTYRNILDLRDEKLISLNEELNALESYIFLLKTRFQGKVHIYNTIKEDHKDHFILPLSLQILIENAVKHNVTSSARPLTVEMYVENGHIIVRNNLQKKDQQYNSTKMGLANIRSRYKLIADKNIVVEETAEYFIVKLPIIQNSSYAHIAS